ncbi:MAG: EthD domain-containing protein [Novosphingobium sp.]
MIITARRNPAMSRRDFHHHLRHVHWPLIQSLPRVEQALGGYVQNHALGPDSPVEAEPAIPVATDRDSVIELFFDNEAALGHLAAIPEYLAQVRPDEAYFNDLPHNMMVQTAPEIVFTAARTGRCKRFDFLARAAGVDAQDFVERIRACGRDLALDPLYTGQIDRLVHNIVGAKGGAGFGAGSFDCVVESWASTFTSLSGVAARHYAIEGVDKLQSFTVYATEFVMIEPASPQAKRSVEHPTSIDAL